MVTKNSLFTLFATSLFILSACQTKPPVRREPSPPVFTPPAPGQPVPPAIERPEPPTKEEPKRVAVILGPGGAKALAHVGVLKALQQQRIPIDKIVGLEWGALIGAMYAHKGQIHDVEWKLYKLEQQDVLRPRSKSLFSRNEGSESIKVLDGFFQDTFGKDEISRGKVGFACPSRSVWTGVVAWQNKGPYREAMKRCVPFPPLFKIQGTFLAGVSQATEAVEQLVREGFNVIIAVNVLGSAVPVAQEALLDNLNHVILWQEIKRALAEWSRLNVELINVDTSAFPMVRFEAKKELIGLGEAAGQKAAGALITRYGF
jgi:NTE family protein